MRSKVLALLATAMAVVGIGVLPSLASATTPETATEGAGVLEPQPQAKSECSPSLICLWQGPNFGGQKSFWHGFDTGCHALENINPESVFNHTGEHTAVFFIGPLNVELGIGPGETFQFGSPYEKGFCIR